MAVSKRILKGKELIVFITVLSFVPKNLCVCVFRNISFYRKKFCASPRESLWLITVFHLGLMKQQLLRRVAFPLIFGVALCFFSPSEIKREQENYHNRRTKRGEGVVYKLRFNPPTLTF